MISPAKCNIYEVNASSALALYGEVIEGEGGEIALVLASVSPSDSVRDALEKSLAALGYGRRACAYVSTRAQDGTAIGANDLMSIIEGVDPLTLVICDANAGKLLGTAYRAPVEADAANRVFGRTAIAFDNLEALIRTPEGKQRAWALLKKMPKLER